MLLYTSGVPFQKRSTFIQFDTSIEILIELRVLLAEQTDQI